MVTQWLHTSCVLHIFFCCLRDPEFRSPAEKNTVLKQNSSSMQKNNMCRSITVAPQSARNNPGCSFMFRNHDYSHDMSASLKHPKPSKTSMHKNCPDNKSENFTESQSNLGCKRHWGAIESSSCSEQGQLDQVAQGLVRFSSEYLQGPICNFHMCSGQLVMLFDHLHGEFSFLLYLIGFKILQPCFCCLSSYRCVPLNRPWLRFPVKYMKPSISSPSLSLFFWRLTNPALSVFPSLSSASALCRECCDLPMTSLCWATPQWTD